LWNGGLLRSIGAIDTVIAAYAIRNDATVFHYDRDFERVASAAPGFRLAWAVPRGTVV
jgi:predicted nucleic acid-binding protein